MTNVDSMAMPGGGVSLYDDYASTTEGARELAAADLALEAIGLLHRAIDESGCKAKDLAKAVGVTEGRVSQVLNGDGNMRLSTLAKYLHACGYSASLTGAPTGQVDGQVRARTLRRGAREVTGRAGALATEWTVRAPNKATWHETVINVCPPTTLAALVDDELYNRRRSAVTQ